MKSPKMSFKGWQLLKFLKGRKRMLVGFVGAGLGWFISDSATVAIVSGAIVEAGFALAEYFMRSY